ncbi:MAG: hypothetical protein HY016_10885 [Nitrosomonadales bacterium]|nr:hypothetical protein [Nitrosomonadales bacterium]
MKNTPTFSEINSLFANDDPEEVWVKVSEIVMRINPAYDFSIARTSFNDVVRLFQGNYPGYCPIKTLYHDLRHMLDVLVCAARLMHGVHLSGTRLSDQEMTAIMIAAMMHDVGYAQQRKEEAGSGAQYTRSRVGRGIKFAQDYIIGKGFPIELATQMEFILRCTDPAVDLSEINFPDERTRLLGQIVGSADLAGQMADRTYLEKLLFLYMEFKEAHFGGYQNVHDLLNKTRYFYVATRRKLDENFAGIYTHLASHFQDLFGVANNYYLESIEKNMAYLTTITALNKAEHRAMLKRGGIVNKAETMITQADFA